MILEGYDLIEKEDVANLHFPVDEVLKKQAQMDLRQKGLNRANALGNLEHHKVRIYFRDEEGDKYIETTIWGVTDHEIVLKKNVVLPIHRITQLEI